jgi:hypothetical protein
MSHLYLRDQPKTNGCEQWVWRRKERMVCAKVIIYHNLLNKLTR